MKKILKIIFVLSVFASLLIGVISHAQSSRPYIFDTAYTEAAPLKASSYTLALSPEANHTLFVFKPDEAGVYELTVNSGAYIGWWGAYTAYVRDPNNKTRTITREIKKVGDMAVIGISSSSSQVTLSITKVGDVEQELEIVYLDYINEHTPTKNQYPDSKSTEPVDITVSHSLFPTGDGSFRLDGETGPIIYVNLYHDDFSLAKVYGEYGALTLRGKLDGVNYDFKKAMKEYNDAVTGTSGIYPLTIDIIRFLKSYGANQMLFEPEFSPFASVAAGNANEESAWMAMCTTLIGYSSEIKEVSVTDSNPSTPLIIDFTTEAHTSSSPVSYLLNNESDDCSIAIIGQNDFTVTYRDISYPSSNNTVVIKAIEKNSSIIIDGDGVFTISVDTHTTCNKERVEGIPASHTDSGKREYWYCNICSKKYDSSTDDSALLTDEQLVIPPTGHVGAESIEQKAPTCTEDGSKAYYLCTVCDKKLDTTTPDAKELEDEDILIPAQGHIDAMQIKASEPTCKNVGSIAYYYCKTCGLKLDGSSKDANPLTDKDIVIPRSDHANTEKVEGADATCTQNGNIEYWICSICGGKFDSEKGDANPLTESEIVISASHKWKEYTPIDDNEHTRECESCSESDEKSKHDFDENGTCKVCGYEIQKQTVIDQIIAFFKGLIEAITNFFKGLIPKK